MKLRIGHVIWLYSIRQLLIPRLSSLHGFDLVTLLFVPYMLNRDVAWDNTGRYDLWHNFKDGRYNTCSIDHQFYSGLMCQTCKCSVAYHYSSSSMCITAWDMILIIKSCITFLCWLQFKVRRMWTWLVKSLLINVFMNLWTLRTLLMSTNFVSFKATPCADSRLKELQTFVNFSS